MITFRDLATNTVPLIPVKWEEKGKVIVCTDRTEFYLFVGRELDGIPATISHEQLMKLPLLSERK